MTIMHKTIPMISDRNGLFLDREEKERVRFFEGFFQTQTRDAVTQCVNELIGTSSSFVRREIGRLLSKIQTPEQKDIVKGVLIKELKLKKHAPISDVSSTFITVLENLGYSLQDIVNEAGLEPHFPHLNREIADKPTPPNLLRRVEQYPMRSWVAVTLFLATIGVNFLQFLIITHLLNRIPDKGPDQQ